MHAALEKERDMYKADAIQATMALNQTFEQIALEQHVKMNPLLKRAVELNCHLPDPFLPPTNHFFTAKIKATKGMKGMKANRPPIVDWNVDNDEVKRRT